MISKKALRSFSYYGWHKGFYSDEDPENSLSSIKYTDFYDECEDEEFPYCSAHQLLCGSCHLFAISLQKTFNYTPYLIQGNNKKRVSRILPSVQKRELVLHRC